MKKYFKKMLVVVLLLSLASCAKREDTGIVTLRWGSDSNPLRKEQIERFERANPGIKVNLDWSSGGLDKILTQTAGGSPPDLFDIYLPEHLGIFAGKGAILDITDYCKRDNVNLKDIWEGCAPMMYYDDRVYAFPANAGTIVLFYNKGLLDEEGIPYPDNTWTWDTFLEAAEKLTKIDPQRKVYRQCGTIVSWALEVFLPYQYGADFYSEDGKKCVCDSEGYKKAYRFMYDLIHKYRVAPTQSEGKSMAGGTSFESEGLNIFCAGKVGLFFYGRWGVITLRKVKDLDWAVAPVPYPVGEERVTFFGSRSTAISSKTKHPEEAFTFLKFLLSRDYNETIASGGDNFPAVISLCESDFFLNDPLHPEETQNQVYVDSVKYSRTVRLSPYFNELDVQRIKGEEIEKMWAGLQSPEEALDKIAQRVNKLIQE